MALPVQIQHKPEIVVWLLFSNRLTQTPATTTAPKNIAAKSKLWNWDLALDQANILAGLKKATK